MVSWNGNPYVRWSFGNHPAPSPSSTRPLLTWSAATAIFAITLGWRKVTGETSVPRRIRSVLAASADSVAQASNDAVPGGEPIGA